MPEKQFALPRVLKKQEPQHEAGWLDSCLLIHKSTESSQVGGVRWSDTPPQEVLGVKGREDVMRLPQSERTEVTGEPLIFKLSLRIL